MNRWLWNDNSKCCYLVLVLTSANSADKTMMALHGSRNCCIHIAIITCIYWLWRYKLYHRPTIHRGVTPLCCPISILGSATLIEPHTNLVRSRVAHLQGCSRAPFPVEVPSIGAAAAALMGRVITYLILPNMVTVWLLLLLEEG